MKKLLTILLSALCLFVGVCFAGCDRNFVEPKRYYGVVQTLENGEDLVVNIPAIGICELPTYADGQKISVKDGDLIYIGLEKLSLQDSEDNFLKLQAP